MRIIQTLIACCGLVGWSVLVALGATVAHAEGAHPVTVALSLDRPIDAGLAPVVVATTDGLFSAERLAVITGITAGSPEAIARVASGASEFAVVDLNALIRFRSRSATPIKAVFVLYNKSPYAIVARKSRGIHAIADLDGKTLGVASGDLSAGLWPALAHQNGINLDHVKQSPISAAVREPMLSAGQIDAVTGFSYLSAVNLRDRGIPADDLAVLRFADYGCVAYGFALIVNPDFAAKRPDAVQGFVRALVAGTNLAIRDEAHAVEKVLTRMEEGSRDLELDRLHTAIRDNILTDEVKRNGLGGVDPARLERAIDQVGEGFKFGKRPSAADIFDDRFLPPRADRLIN